MSAPIIPAFWLMAVTPRIKVKVPEINIKTPEDRRFWRAVGIEMAKDIRKRTEGGKDADERRFRPYAKSTVIDRVKRGRTSQVNLTDTGKMLGAMARGIRESKSGVKIRITGRDGFKAGNIKFDQRRNFFSFNDKQVLKVVKLIKKWMVRKNK